MMERGGGHIQLNRSFGTSGLDTDLDQWVFHPLLFNLMSILLHIAENAKP